MSKRCLTETSEPLPGLTTEDLADLEVIEKEKAYNRKHPERMLYGEDFENAVKDALGIK